MFINNYAKKIEEIKREILRTTHICQCSCGCRLQSDQPLPQHVCKFCARGQHKINQRSHAGKIATKENGALQTTALAVTYR